MSDIHQRHVPLFYVAAVYNLLAASSALFLTELHFSLFFTEAAASSGPIVAINTQAFWVCVVLFGVGYFFVARDPVHNRSILYLGVPGKAYVFFFFTLHYFQGHVTVIALLGGIGDLVLALLFLRYLLKTR